MIALVAVTFSSGLVIKSANVDRPEFIVYL